MDIGVHDSLERIFDCCESQQETSPLPMPKKNKDWLEMLTKEIRVWISTDYESSKTPEDIYKMKKRLERLI